MTTTPATLPLLRFRQGNDDGVFEHPITIVGRIVDFDEHSIVIDRGRMLRTALYVVDLFDPLGGPEMATELLLDAAASGDVVSIALHADRITYDNDRQLERLEREVGRSPDR